MTTKDGFDRPPGDAGGGNRAVSRPELEWLEERRSKPIPVRALTPIMSYQSHAQEWARLDARIAGIREQLDGRNGQAKEGFEKAAVRGRAKYDFDRSR